MAPTTESNSDFCMFKRRKISIGSLSEDELELAWSFLNGESWRELLEGDVPQWLAEWSAQWRQVPLFSFDFDSDPIFANGSIWCDDSRAEYWFVDEGADGPPLIHRIPAEAGHLTGENVCRVVFQYIEETYDEMPLRGNFTITGPEWLPRDRMAQFVAKQMSEFDIDTLGGEQDLSLEQWLNREYGGFSDCPTS